MAIEADVELGGTDQLFNLMAGRALQEDFGQEPQTVLCMSMIEGTDGRKMSTTWANAVYLLDPPHEQYGKIMSMGDQIIPLYMEAATRMPMEEVERVRKGLEDGTVNPMDAKKMLAWELVMMYHGEEANQAAEDFKRQFQEHGVPVNVPTVTVEKARGDKADENGEVGILDLLVNTGTAPSKKHAQRLIEQKAVRVNDEVVADREHRV